MRYHYYKTAICPKLPGVLVSYNHTNWLCALKEKHPVGFYLGYMTEEEAMARLEGNSKRSMNFKNRIMRRR